jgi:hypothetical protein
MTKQVQRRRGTATQHTSFTGAEGELSVNTTNKSVHVHDNVTAGGFEAARADMDNVTSSSILTAAGITATTTELNYVDGVTSSIQTQLDGKAGTASPTFTGTLTTANLTATGTTTLAGASTSADITFGDNDKAIFGAGSDLQIYHDGSGSRIYENGTGVLAFYSNGSGINFYKGEAAENMLTLSTDGAVTAYYDGSQKLATTNTGVDITGTLTSDGLTVDGSGSVSAKIESTGANYSELNLKNTSANYTLGVRPDLSHALVVRDAGNSANRASFATNGDISFYEDTGTTAKFFWDASAESLGIGDTTFAAGKLRVYDNAGNHLWLKGRASDGTSAVSFRNNADDTYNGRIEVDDTNGMRFQVNTAERMRIGSNGDIGIGTTTPMVKLHVHDSTAARFALTNSTTGQTFPDGFELLATGLDAYLQNRSNGNMIFTTNNTERMRLDSSGNVGIGTSSPSSYYANQLVVDTGSAIQSGITIVSDTGNSGMFAFADGTSGNQRYRGYLNYNHSNDTLGIGTAGGESMRLDASGNVGIGTTSPSQKLEVSDTTTATVIVRVTNNDGNAEMQKHQEHLYINLNDTGNIFFRSGSTITERMRIDSSGNLLVGKTSTSLADAGARILPTGQVYSTASGAAPFAANRLSSDGAIMELYKDTGLVGSIGSIVGTRASFRSANTVGYLGVGSTDYYGFKSTAFVPTTTGSYDLGGSVEKFKDLYLSGGVYLGGTGSANLLDDYEEGTWTPTISSGTVTAENAWYVKVGTLITISAKFSGFSDTSSGTSVTVGGVPFTTKASDHTAQGSMIADYLSNGPYFPYISSNATTIRFYIQSTTNYTTMVHSNLGSSGSFYFTLTYQTQ